MGFGSGSHLEEYSEGGRDFLAPVIRMPDTQEEKRALLEELRESDKVFFESDNGEPKELKVGCLAVVESMSPDLVNGSDTKMAIVVVSRLFEIGFGPEITVDVTGYWVGKIILVSKKTLLGEALLGKGTGFLAYANKNNGGNPVVELIINRIERPSYTLAVFKRLFNSYLPS